MAVIYHGKLPLYFYNIGTWSGFVLLLEPVQQSLSSPPCSPEAAQTSANERKINGQF
jgi:hypothetical protein